jgi:hypothetical protein
VRGVDTTHHRRAVRLIPAVALEALTIYRDDQARCHIEVLCRDATQFSGLTDSQARSQAKRHLYCNARLRAVTLAKRDTRQHNGDAASVFSMASLKRRAFNHHLIEPMSKHVAQGHSVEKSRPAYEELRHYGTMTGLDV